MVEIRGIIDNMSSILFVKKMGRTLTVSGAWPGLPDPQCLASFFSLKKNHFLIDIFFLWVFFTIISEFMFCFLKRTCGA